MERQSKSIKLDYARKEITDLLTDEEAGQLFKALIDNVGGFEFKTDNRTLEMAYIVFVQDIERG